jgi:hypothetical protein
VKYHNVVVSVVVDWYLHARKPLISLCLSTTTAYLKLTPVLRAFAVRFFTYPRWYFSIMGNISILSTATIQAVAQTHCVCAGSSTHSPHYFDSGGGAGGKLRSLKVSHFDGLPHPWVWRCVGRSNGLDGVHRLWLIIAPLNHSLN